MGITLYEHNRVAYESALAMLSETGKAAVIHPTGTGKSFIGFKLCEDNPDKTVLWLSPSEYIFQTQLQNLKATGGEEPENAVFITYAKLMNMGDEALCDIKPFDKTNESTSFYAFCIREIIRRHNDAAFIRVWVMIESPLEKYYKKLLFVKDGRHENPFITYSLKDDVISEAILHNKGNWINASFLDLD